MVSKLIRAGVLLLVLGSLTGCEGCERKRSVPVTQQLAAPAAVALAPGASTTDCLAGRQGA